MGENNLGAFSRPLISQRINCINCNICVNSSNTQIRHLVLEQNIRVVSIISTWIYPVIITEADYICLACLNFAIQAVNNELNEGVEDRCTGAGSSRRGHMEVCFMCGRSLAKRQSHLILTTACQRMIQIVEGRVAPRQISTSDRLCHACFMHVKRQAIRNLENDARRLVNNDNESINSENDAAIADNMQAEIQEQSDPEPSAEPDEAPQPSNSSGSPVTDTSEQAEPIQPHHDTILRNYRRAPNTASHCIFHGCEQLSDLITVSDPLRSTLLINYKYYIPVRARVCSDHLRQNNWDSLYDAHNSLSNFTVEHIEHMLSLSMVKKC